MITSKNGIQKICLSLSHVAGSQGKTEKKPVLSEHRLVKLLSTGLHEGGSNSSLRGSNSAVLTSCGDRNLGELGLYRALTGPPADFLG